MDRTLRGISASPGIVVGTAHLLRWELPEVPHRIIADDDVPAEIARFHAARERAQERLQQVRDRVERRAGVSEANIFEVHQLLLADPEMLKDVEWRIRHNLVAEEAFHQTMSHTREMFARSTSAEWRERANDILDVEIRVLSILLGLRDHDPLDVEPGTSVVLVAHDLTPSLTVQLDRQAIAGIATDVGTRTSHVAILARSLGLPAVVGLRDATARLQGGELVILDGSAGTLNVNPTPQEEEHYRERAEVEASMDAELLRYAMQEPVSLDGVRITVRANVDVPDEAVRAAHSGAEGVGLMRTEFLVVSRTTMPDEEEQYQAYTRVLEAFPSQPVIIRTYDIGGDKLPVGGFPSETNPFLGWRAIRMCLDQPEIFAPQLRALLRAAVHGDLRILLPLIVSVDEIDQTRAMLAEAAADLAARGVPHRVDVPLGIMVETPAAALDVDRLVEHVGFFSIGTNDLTQYTLAVDRGNANLESRFTPLHPSVLRLIERTAAVGNAKGIEVCVCGEMASHRLTAFTLLGLGVRSISTAARVVPTMKALIRSIRVADAVDAACEATRARSAAEAERILRERYRAAVGDTPALLDGLPAS